MSRKKCDRCGSDSPLETFGRCRGCGKVLCGTCWSHGCCCGRSQLEWRGPYPGQQIDMTVIDDPVSVSPPDSLLESDSGADYETGDWGVDFGDGGGE